MQVPNEDHMALIAYSDQLPRIVHDEVMRVLESPVGQQAENFADALFRNRLADGRNCLEVLHKEGLMKKVQTSQVIMTPTGASRIRLDELNNILAEMKKGDAAIERMAELDRNGGFADPRQKAADKKAQHLEEILETIEIPPLVSDDVLSDSQIADSQRLQALKMRTEAQAMFVEADRLDAEATLLNPPKAAPAIVEAKIEPVKKAKRAYTKRSVTNGSTSKA